MENTGVIIQEQKEDFIAGALPYKKVCEDWTSYLPTDERQHGVYFDTKACVTFSALNVVETQVNYLIDNGLIPAQILKDLDDMGYLVNSKFECSDRFTAKMSGTTHHGNYLQRVWNSIRKDGLLPEKDWGYPRTQRTPVFVWDDYYKEIPQDLKDKAKKILDYFDFSYEWTVNGKITEYSNNEISEIKRELKHTPLQLASPICPTINGVKEPCGKTKSTHATMIYKIDGLIHYFDHYDPFRRKLSQKYIMPYILKGVVTLKANNKTMKIIGNKQDNRQYLLGNDNVIRWIFNQTLLEQLHSAGIINKNEIEWVDDISRFIKGDIWAVIKN